MLDVEIVKIFEQSLAEDVPYMIELHNTRFADWIERHKEYWEKNRNLRITFHTPTHNVWAIPIR